MEMNTDPNQRLYENIRFLIGILSVHLKKQLGSKFLEQLDAIALEAQNLEREPEETVKKVQVIIRSLPDTEILFVARAFSQFLNLTNIAEQYHRIRRSRWYQSHGRTPQPG